MPSPAEPSLPYDPEARYSTKREVEWVGYKVHLTETCEPDTRRFDCQCRDDACDHTR